LVDEDIAMGYDADIGARVGLRWALGPFEMMNRRGTAQALELVTRLAARWRMKVPESLAAQGKTNDPFLIEYVKSRPDNGVVTITVNRPDAMNALNEIVGEQLVGIFTYMSRQPETQGVVIAAAGRSFVAGADIRFFIRNIECN